MTCLAKTRRNFVLAMFASTTLPPGQAVLGCRAWFLLYFWSRSSMSQSGFIPIPRRLSRLRKSSRPQHPKIQRRSSDAKRQNLQRKSAMSNNGSCTTDVNKKCCQECLTCNQSQPLVAVDFETEVTLSLLIINKLQASMGYLWSQSFLGNSEPANGPTCSGECIE